MDPDPDQERLLPEMVFACKCSSRILSAEDADRLMHTRVM